LSESLGLTNIEKEYKGKLPPTFPQSGKTIDFILISEGVKKCIEAVGRTPHIKKTLGDHRGSYVDINVAKLLGIGKVDMAMMPGRKLQSKNTKATKDYLKQTRLSWTEHKVFERMENLCEDLRNTKIMTEEMIETYNKIDRDVFRLCLSAEKECVHVSTRRYAWSQKLDQAIKKERLWETIVKIGWDTTNSTIQILSK